MTDESRDATSVADPEPVESPRQRRHLPLWQETVLLLVFAVVLAVVIKAFFLQAFYIPSPSMEPGLVKNDRILVEKMSYWGSGTPQRGDVVVFKDPGDWLTAEEDAGPSNPLGALMAHIGLYPSGGHLVKRVIGVAGDTIHCCDKQGRLVVNGVPLNESAYVKTSPGMQCNGPMIGCSWTDGPVPAGHVFVMGDNRNHSADSTVHMCSPQVTDCVPGDEYVPVSDVVGKVFVLLWPRSRFHVLHRPADFADVPDAP